MLEVMAVFHLDSTGTSNYSDSFEPEEELESSNSSVDSAIQVVSQIKSLAMTEQKSHSQPGAERSMINASKSAVVKRATSRVGTDQTNAGGAASPAKSFTDSFAVRDAVFSEWLRNKQSKTVNDKREKVQAKKREEEARREKLTVRVERVERSVSKWNAAKEKELLEKQKSKKEEQMKQSLQAQEKEERQQVSEMASKSWREKKTKQLVIDQRERRRKVQEEEERKRAEALEKVEIAERAFKVWSQKKDEVIHEARQKQKQQKSEIELRQREENLERKEESHKAHVAWKNKKDDIIKSDGRLYTYKDSSRAKIHPTAWCPARSIRYNYPAEKTVKTTRSGSTGSARSYSTASFRSDQTLSSAEESRTVSPQGKRKTIQVCCQTLEYWCTCDDH